MRGEPLRLTIDSTDDRDVAIAALGALFGVRLAVVTDAAIGDTPQPGTEGASAAASRPPRRRGAKSPARIVSRATGGGGRRFPRKAAPAVRSAGTAGLNAQIRSWAHRQGIAVASRGRIPASVLDAYRAANPA